MPLRYNHNAPFAMTGDAPAWRRANSKLRIRVNGKWMRLVSKKRNVELKRVFRPVEYFCKQGRGYQEAVLQSIKPSNTDTKFIHFAMTHSFSQAAVSWRHQKIFVNRAVAIADFDTYMPKKLEYFSGMIAFEPWLMFFEDSRESAYFPLWRAVIEVPRKTKSASLARKGDYDALCWARDLDGLGEIEAAAASLLGGPAPHILRALDAPIRVIDA